MGVGVGVGVVIGPMRKMQYTIPVNREPKGIKRH